MNNNLIKYLFPFSIIGFTAVIAQILFIREFMAIFYGNEIYVGIVIANWLLWTAAGSFLCGKISNRFSNPQLLMSFIQILISIITPLTIVLIRISKPLLQSLPGEVLGLPEIYFTSFVILSFFCFASGGLFTVGSILSLENENGSIASSSGFVYLVESLGSALGGLFISFLLIPNFTSIQICIFLALFNVLSAIWLVSISKNVKKKILFTCIYILVLVFSIISIIELDSISMKYLWKGFNVIENNNSRYGNITVVEEAGIKTVYENSVIVYNYSDIQSAEENVHYALLQHEKPEKVLLIGGGLAGGIEESLKHPSLSHLEYVELDPALIEMATKFRDTSWADLNEDTRVDVYLTDGRLFLENSNNKYDVILVNIPDPSTAQLNRFYTYEFFLSVFSKLKVNGIFSFQVSSSENYISEQLAIYLRCINKTLNSVFEKTALIPGNKVHFFAFPGEQDFIVNSDTLLNRMKRRKINTQYIREYYIPFRLKSERIKDLQNIIQFDDQTPINKDFTPIAYFLYSVFWTTQFIPDLTTGFILPQGIQIFTVTIAFIIIPFLVILLFLKKSTSQKYFRFSLGFAVVCMGFSTIALEILLIMAFQCLYGYVYHQLALLIAAFMCGIAIGSWYSLKRIRIKEFSIFHLKWIHIITIVFIISLIGILEILNQTNIANMLTWGSQIIFPLLTLITGSFGGYQFVLASNLYFRDDSQKNQNIGIIYGLDLIGAMFGGITLSSFIIPLFGFFKTAILLTIVNFLVVSFLLFYKKNGNNISYSR